MSKKIYIPIIIGCLFFLSLAWVITINTKSPAQRQIALIEQAVQMMENGIYIRAVPLLEEAASYNALHTIDAETKLKRAYLALIEGGDFFRRYTALLEKQMSRRDAPPEVFIEAAEFNLDRSKARDAFAILRTGIEKTNSTEIIELYEKSRYAFELSWIRYDYISAMYDGTASVLSEGKWGVARSDGTLIIPTDYEQISTFHQNIAVVKYAGEIYAIDENNNKTAIADEEITDFKNISSGRAVVLTDDGWRRATSDLILGTKSFESAGMYSEGYMAAKIGGKWGVIGLATDWLIEPEHNDIVKDEHGRSYGQGAVFVKVEGSVELYVNGSSTNELFDDARPFSDTGYAAVMQDGKWGFIDADGELKIDYKFDDALSFSGHLAAVKIGELWGYINTNGDVVIAAEFYEAKSFSRGSAPVKTEQGWRFLALIEFKGGLTL